MNFKHYILAACLCGILPSALCAEPVQVVQHVGESRRLPVQIDLKTLNMKGDHVAYDTKGKALPTQRVGDLLFVDMPIAGLNTAVCDLRPGQPTAALSLFKIDRQNAAISVVNSSATWIIRADGSATVAWQGRTALLKTGLPAGATISVQTQGSLITDVLLQSGDQKATLRLFANSPYFQLTTDSEKSLGTTIQISGAENSKTRLLASHKCSAWGVWSYMDDVERDYKSFDFFFPLDWATLERDGAGIALLPQSSGFRINLRRADASTWTATAAPMTELKDKDFDFWHEAHEQGIAPEHRYENVAMPRQRTISGCLISKDPLQESIAWHLQSLPDVIVRLAEGKMTSAHIFAGQPQIATIEDRNKDGIADLAHDKWTWTNAAGTQLIYEFEGAGSQMEKTKIYAGLPYARGIKDSKTASVPRLTMTARRHDGTFCQGSTFFGGTMNSGSMAYDVNLSGNLTKDHTGNYVLMCYDLDGDGDSDIIHLDSANIGLGTKQIPQFFLGEAGSMVDIADKPTLIGVALDPFTGYAHPMFPVRYQSAGDSLTHFWTLVKSVIGWWVKIDDTLLGGHDWPQAVMDRNNDGYADLRFYTEAFLFKKDESKPLTMENAMLHANPMRWAMNLDGNTDQLTGDAMAHFQMSERARNWDVCIFPRRIMTQQQIADEFKANGSKGLIKAGYAEFPFFSKRVYNDAYGNQIGFSGANEPPADWKGQRISFFDAKTGQRTGWGSGLDWIAKQPFGVIWAGYTDYECPNTHGPEATHPGANAMNRVDVDSFGRAVHDKYSLYFSPITGRMHLKGANWGADLTYEKSYEDPTLKLETVPLKKTELAYQYWVWAIDPDTIRPGNWWSQQDGKVGPNRRFAYFDMDGDGYFDTYLFRASDSKINDYDSAFYLTPQSQIRADQPSPFTVTLAHQDFAAVWTSALDFRSQSVLPQSAQEQKALEDLTRQTQAKVIASQNKLRLANATTLKIVQNKPVATGFTPALLLKDARGKVAVSSYHGGELGRWENWTDRGLAAARTAITSLGAQCVEISQPWSADVLATLDLVVLNASTAKPYDSAEIAALEQFVRAGGRIVVTLPSSKQELGTLQPVLKMLNISASTPFATASAWRPYEKTLFYTMVDGLTFSSDPNAPSDIRDVSGKRLFFTQYDKNSGIDQLVIRGGWLLEGGSPVLTYSGKPFVTQVSLGSGTACVIGTEDLTSNMCIAISMNPPRGMIYAAQAGSKDFGGAASSAFWSRYDGGRVVRNNLLATLIGDRKPTIETDGKQYKVTLRRSAEIWLPAQSTLSLDGLKETRQGDYRVFAAKPGVYTAK